MAIKLDYILKRNKNTLVTFITKNKLTSYFDFIQYFRKRNLIPCEKDEFEIALSKLSKNSTTVASKSEVKNVHQSKPERKKVGRKTSKAREPKKRRNSRKKQHPTPKLPDSSNEG